MARKLYDWAGWFAKKQFVLQRGLDYWCPQSGMAGQIRNAAVKYGVKVSIRESLNGSVLIVTVTEGKTSQSCTPVTHSRRPYKRGKQQTLSSPSVKTAPGRLSLVSSAEVQETPVSFDACGRLSDVINTSFLFAHLDKQGKEECSGMLAKAVDLLWRRTAGADAERNPLGFLKRHPKLLACVRFLYRANREGRRPIRVLKLCAGECAALMYLMSSSASDGDKYRNGEPPNEQLLDWSNAVGACNFWSRFADYAPSLKPVRAALDDLYNVEKSPRWPRGETFTVLAKAWNLFLAGDKLTKENLTLDHGERPKVGGIDQGEPYSSDLGE
jgi:hypothetical protein